jgi:hypothetical protein
MITKVVENIVKIDEIKVFKFYLSIVCFSWVQVAVYVPVECHLIDSDNKGHEATPTCTTTY